MVAQFSTHAIMPCDPVEVALRHVHYALDAQRRMLYEMERDIGHLRSMDRELIRKPCCCPCSAVRADPEDTKG